MRRTKLQTLSLAGAIALSALWCTGCAGNVETTASAKTEPDLRNVAVTRVVRQDLAREIELAAEFRPNQEIDLHAKVSGYLKDIYVDVGDRVQRGQSIALLEVPEMDNDLAQATAAWKRSELDVQRAKGDLQRAENALSIRELSFNRLSGVLKARPNLVAQHEIDTASAHFHDAQAQVVAARATLAAAEEQVRAAAANHERIQTMMSYLKISAPFSGVVTKRYGDPGAMIQAGTASQTQAMPVVRLSEIDHLRLVLPVPESIVPRIKIGAPVEVRVDSLKRVFQGRVSRFSGKLASSTRTMETEVDIPNPNRVLMPGMYGYASLKLDRRQDAVAVPVQAVVGSGMSPTVMVVADGVVTERQIVPGIETPDMVEVVSGLAEGELVVLGARSSLKAGTRVQPTLIDAPSAPRGDH
jgi:RND family efflux transporter MFP subunit